MKKEKPNDPWQPYWSRDRVFMSIGVVAVLMMILGLGAAIGIWINEKRSDSNPNLQNPAQRY